MATRKPRNTKPTAPSPLPTPASVAVPAQPATGVAAPGVAAVVAETVLAGYSHPSLAYNLPKPGVAAQVLTLGAKPYRVKAAHTAATWAAVQAALAAGGGTATWQALALAGAPAHFVGYCLRRGTLAVAPPAPQPAAAPAPAAKPARKRK